MTDDRELELASRVAGGRPTYRFRTADGIFSPDGFRTSDRLLLDSLWGRDLGDVRCLQANYGVVGIVLAAVADSMELAESSARAAGCCRRNCRLNDVDATVTLDPGLSTDPVPGFPSVEPPERADALEAPDSGGTTDTTIYAPKPYTPASVANQRIADGLAATRPGGRLYLAASKRTGLSRYERCLEELATDVQRVATRDGVALLEGTRPETVERRSFVTARSLTPTVDGTTLSLVTVPGLFSASRLDEGTRLLLETCSVEDGDRVLDACCGYGPIGVYAALTADCEVWLTDDDALAARCARASCRSSGIAAAVHVGDCTGGVADQSFDHVLCNPPTHAGRGVLSELFAGIRRVLPRDGGNLTIVHHRGLDLDGYLERFPGIRTRRIGESHVVRTTW